MSGGLRRTLKLLPTLTHVRTCSTICATKRPKFAFTKPPASRALPRQLHTTRVPCSSVIPFKLSDIGEGIAEVTIKEWYVNVGDEVAQFDNICEVQSDKATVTITCRYDGVVRAIHFGTDDTCKVGQALVDIEVSDDDVEYTKPTTNSSKTAEEEPSIVSPKVIETEKKEILTTPAVRKMASDRKLDTTVVTPSYSPPPTVSQHHKVDLSKVAATGRGGRITKEDLQAYITANAQTDIPTYTQPPTMPSSPAPDAPVAEIPTAHFYNTSAPYIPQSFPQHKDRTVEIKGIAKVMVRTMTAAQAVPRFTYHDQYNVNSIVRLKKLMKAVGKERNVKLTFMPILVKAASQALLDFPMINAHVNADCSAITYKAAHNIGIATDTPHGLMVPNIKNVQNMSILDIAKELQRLKTLSASNKLSTDDVTGGTFSLSNVGAVGGTYASPMLVVPEVCIGAFGKIQRRPEYNKHDEVEEMNYMCVSWSGDHRVIDGATVARYSNVVRGFIEHPDTLLFNLK